MNKEDFNQLVQDYSKVDKHLNSLEKLLTEYPYSQSVRMLNVKACSISGTKNYKQRLALAAFYTTDRNVLRSLIEKGKVPGDYLKKNVAKRLRSAAKLSSPNISKSISKSQGQNTNAEELRKEVLANLELLQKNKLLFLKLTDLDTPKKIAKKKSVKKATEAVESKPRPTKIKEAKSAPKKSPKAKKKELIDKFIAEEPRITPKKILDDNQSDLSSASSELREDLVSENLAVIFAKQGKNLKAIEIYKKLIWKFPQKKASFAAQIEKLKKK